MTTHRRRLDTNTPFHAYRPFYPITHAGLFGIRVRRNCDCLIWRFASHFLFLMISPFYYSSAVSTSGLSWISPLRGYPPVRSTEYALPPSRMCVCALVFLAPYGPISALYNGARPSPFEPFCFLLWLVVSPYDVLMKNTNKEKF